MGYSMAPREVTGAERTGWACAAGLTTPNSKRWLVEMEIMLSANGGAMDTIIFNVWKQSLCHYVTHVK